MNGAIGAILYDDPIEFTDTGNPDNVYPKSIFLPKSGVQRGSLLVHSGDPMTPGYPSISNNFNIIYKFLQI